MGQLKISETGCSEEVRASARAMYEAYIENSDGKNFRGEQCPPWPELTDAVRSHWCAAAIAMHARVEAVTIERDSWKRRAEQHGCDVEEGDHECA